MTTTTTGVQRDLAITGPDALDRLLQGEGQQLMTDLAEKHPDAAAVVNQKYLSLITGQSAASYARAATLALAPSKVATAGVIGLCDKDTIVDCRRRRVLGFGTGFLARVTKLQPGAPCFIFDTSTRSLYGGFVVEAVGEHLDKIAWGDRNKDYPVQVQFAQDPAISSGEKMQNAIQIRENQFKSIVTYKDSKRMELFLDGDTAAALAGLFCESVA